MTTEEKDIKKIYEVSYHIVSSVPEEGVSAKVSAIKEQIEKLGGTVLREGEPEYMELAYPMERSIGNKQKGFSHAYFGWMKFETTPKAARELHGVLSGNEDILRFLIIKTIREDTFFSKKTEVKERKGEKDERSDSQEKEPKADKKAEPEDAELDKTIEKLVTE